jgi:2'-5' RNA ligase
MDIEAFRSERKAAFVDASRVLLPKVRAALGDDDRLREVAREAFQTAWPEATPARRGAFLRAISEALSQTTADSDPVLVADWLAVAAANYATVSRARPGVRKTWVTMDDEHVRDTHARLHRTSRTLGGAWSIKGTRVRFPGQPVGPLEVWINCRCLLAVEAGALTAAGHDLIFLENRRTPKVVSRGAKYDPKPSEGRIVRRRKANADEERTIARGDWVRVNEKGDKPSDPGYMRKKSKVRPQLNALEAAMDDEPRSNVIVAGVPADGHPIHGASSEPAAHLTMLWFGEAADADLDAIAEHVADIAARFQPVEMPVLSRETLGDDKADVLMVDPAGMEDIRAALLGHESVKEAWAAVEQYPKWTPHVTLGYPDTPALADPPESILIDRLALWTGEYEGPTFTLGADTMDDDDLLDAEDVADAPAPDEAGEPLWHDDAMRVEPLECHGVLAPEGVPSGDGRMFQAEALGWRDLPIPLLWQPSNLPGHEGAVVVGQISQIARDGNLLRWSGRFADTPDADRVAGLIGERAMRGVSVDVDSVEAALDDRENGGMLELSKGRISAATICAIPAFAEAYIALGPGPVVDPQDQGAPSFAGQVTIEAAIEEAEAAADDEFKRGPGWVTDPAPTARIHHYWTKGEGAAKIRWGTPGDFTRCTRELRKYVGPEFLNRTCAQWHHDALGYWPGDKGKPGNAPLSAATDEDCEPCQTEALTAAVTLLREDRTVLPAAWFSDPGLTGPTPITVTEDGRVYGHLATWGTCHIGIQDTCVTAPPSKSQYGYFRTGVVLTDSGEVPVGSLTMDTGHAPLSARARAAAAHYDNTGAVVADVAAGEDAHGIWVAGAMRSGLDEQQVARFRASALSGDWRSIQGHLELVGALAVNVPGFPIPRAAFASDSTHGQTALVAAGVVNPDPFSQRLAAVLAEQRAMRAAMLMKEMA